MIQAQRRSLRSLEADPSVFRQGCLQNVQGAAHIWSEFRNVFGQFGGKVPFKYSAGQGSAGSLSGRSDSGHQFRLSRDVLARYNHGVAVNAEPVKTNLTFGDLLLQLFHVQDRAGSNQQLVVVVPAGTRGQQVMRVRA